ncbi:hypothetical protein EJ08DRAFT_735043 [Tothia fuscella]|uniref:Uncharacterized protein n=1 Tax=Tothia fuscella TaxID=1048955 RepID=A0A9P4NPE4_9PEZI|nr:hypothetical protein EJ08DRAFT_735043 [Tothia fuscella]
MATTTHSKFLIQMSGAPGSGKTTLSTLLSKHINAIIIEHDILKTFFLNASFPWERATNLTYSMQWTLAEEMMKQDHSVIIDSTCNYEQVLKQGKKLAEKYGFEYKYVECRVRREDVGTLDERIRGREPLRSQRRGVDEPPPDAKGVKGAIQDGDEAAYRALFMKWVENPCRPDQGVIVVESNGGKSSQDCLEYVLEQLRGSVHVDDVSAGVKMSNWDWGQDDSRAGDYGRGFGGGYGGGYGGNYDGASWDGGPYDGAYDEEDYDSEWGEGEGAYEEWGNDGWDGMDGGD